jgi:L-rhamnose mutarotase
MTQEKYAFRMTLNPGMKAEYIRRHDEIWPELVALLKDAGVSDCSGDAAATRWMTCPIIL